MMAGAERERGLDFNADIVGLRPRTIMRAVDNKATCAHRLEAGQAPGHPVGSGDRLEAECVRRGLAGSDRDQAAQAAFIRRFTKVHSKLPASVFAFKSGTGGILAIEQLAEIAGKAPRSRFVAGQAGHSGGSIHAPQNSSFASARAMAI